MKDDRDESKESLTEELAEELKTYGIDVGNERIQRMIKITETAVELTELCKTNGDRTSILLRKLINMWLAAIMTNTVDMIDHYVEFMIAKTGRQQMTKENES